MGALAGLVAHGGIAGAVIEALVGLAVLGVFVAIWLRERQAPSEIDDDGARLRDEDGTPPGA